MRLTIEQAIGQKLMLSFVGTEPSSNILTTIQNHHIGGVTKEIGTRGCRYINQDVV